MNKKLLMKWTIIWLIAVVLTLIFQLLMGQTPTNGSQGSKIGPYEANEVHIIEMPAKAEKKQPRINIYSSKLIEKVDPENPNPKWTKIGTFEITNYTLSPEECSKEPDDLWYGFGASGRKVEPGLSVATDWEILPNGTKIYIEGIGERRVDDTGNLVKGKIIDVYIGDPVENPNIREKAFAFGRQERTVWILDEQ